MIYDYCIIGGGLVGLATAFNILKIRPDANLVLLEKENEIAFHQSGHNSGVIHAGIYYAPNSLKARLCREGLRETIAFCQTHGIPYEQCGKLIIATNGTEEKRLDELYARATANGLKLTYISREQLSAIEPRINGTAALLSPETGIVDFRRVAGRLAEAIRQHDAKVVLGCEVEGICEKNDRVEINAAHATWLSRKVVVCAGLQADRLARLAGLDVDFQVIPFRGEYYRLPQDKSDIVKHLIYPAPDPALPFLGIHLTRMIDGSVTVGPNAVLGFAREGYPKYSRDLRDVASYVGFPGFWKLMWKHRRHAAHELRGSLWRAAYLADCRKYCPELELSDLLPCSAGIRAQVVTRKGVAVHDFLFGETDRMFHVYNAPSPAATSSIPIGRMIAERCVGVSSGMQCEGGKPQSSVTSKVV